MRCRMVVRSQEIERGVGGLGAWNRHIWAENESRLEQAVAFHCHIIQILPPLGTMCTLEKHSVIRLNF